MTHLPLRLRVFLFFCLLALGSVIIAWAGLWLGFRQLGNADAMSAFVTSAIVAGFGLPALAVFIWLLFDTNVAKPIEALAAGLRVGAHGGKGAFDDELAPYLGDLAPAAAAIHTRLSALNADASETIAAETDRLRRHRQQLLQLLSDMPVATLLMRPDHQIVLYDGQAAALMANEAPVRLDGSLFDYLDRGPINEALERLETQGATRRAIAVTGHSGAIYAGHIRQFENGCYALMLDPLETDAARPMTYDLDLMDKTISAEESATSLRDLTFVAFDTETTGLDPKTDDVVQVGAVRIVNGKIVEGEGFDALVNPGRPIPAQSTKVHHISDAMVADAPPFSKVCQSFNGFATGSVLLAHNAPFDMAFLRRETADKDYDFAHSVLDTVHLSAIVFGGSAEHTLDALCSRLEIVIPAEVRHTALGDAVATAKAFVAMLPILESKGLSTLGAVLEECRKHQRLLESA